MFFLKALFFRVSSTSPCYSWHALTLQQALQTFNLRNNSSRSFENCTQNVEYTSEECEAFVEDGLIIFENFITASEEKSLLDEIEPKWGRLKYQDGHWDNAIQNYRELEVSSLQQSFPIIERIQKAAFNPESALRDQIHILDLSTNGYIKPHIDSIKFCGTSIAGLSLLSSSVMKFVHEKNPAMWMKALLKPRSLYIMQNRVRYHFTHEILKSKESYFKGRHINKTRRISVLCRTLPPSEMLQPDNIFRSIPVSLDEVT